MERFSLYFERWLYANDGYYAQMPRIGKEGDFYTSVSTSIFFGGTIGKLVVDMVKNGQLAQNSHVVEIGAHAGYALADAIQFIYTLEPALLKTLKFAIIEPLQKVREAQKTYMYDSFGDAIDFKIYESLDEFRSGEAFVFSNELFDAFTCEVLLDEKMLYMYEDKPVFGEILPHIKELANTLHVAKGEIAQGYEEFAKKLALSCKKCEFIAFDYGDMTPRNDISLRVYKSHETHPFFELTSLVGESDRLSEFFASSDITYDVNFAHLKYAMVEAGFKKIKYSTQMSALIEFGILELLEILSKNSDEKSYKMELEKAKQLLLPDFLGERFKMIRFRK